VFGSEKELLNGMDQEAFVKIWEAGGTVLFSQIGDMPSRCKEDSSVSRKPRRLKNRDKIHRQSRYPHPRDNQQEHAGSHPQRAFREDLYYRLNVMFIHVPPLRDRIEDLPDLAGHFIGRMNPTSETQISGISSEALSLLSSHDWPGNVRELRNVLERAEILCDGPMISEQDVRMALREGPAEPPRAATAPGQTKNMKNETVSLRETLNKIEKDLILDALRKTGGSR